MRLIRNLVALLALAVPLTYLALPASATVEVSPITGGTITDLTDAATVTWEGNRGYVYRLTPAGNRTMQNPTNLTVGVTYILMIVQDSTGSRTLTWGSAFRFPAASFSPIGISDAAVPPTLSTWPASTTVLTFLSDGTNLNLLASAKDIEGYVAPPSLLTATQNVVNQVNLGWTDNSSDETGFEIFKLNAGDYEYLASVAAGVHVYSDTNGDPDPGTSYLVRAVRGGDRSVFSNGATGFEL